MYDGERFDVIHHSDAKGSWYRVIDKQSANATIKTFRSQAAAHRFCRQTNAGWRRVHAISESGSDWFHAGMPS